MKTIQGITIIGVDHGYGNIKTANHCFPTGILKQDEEPSFTNDLLIYAGRYHLIGEGHKEFLPQKVEDEDYYILTLAAIAMELQDAGLTEADVLLAAGLPLTWTGRQKDAFAAYLSRNEQVAFVFRNTEYKIRIVGVKIYPQGYAAIAEFAAGMKGVNLVCDIGNGTMNTLYMVDGRPQPGKMYTEKFGTHQCTLAIREAFSRATQREISDYVIESVLRTGKADIPPTELRIIKTAATDYVQEIFRRLREHGYDANTMKLYITGGGGCLVKHFGKPGSRVIFVDDICAAAKGYELLAELQLGANAG